MRQKSVMSWFCQCSCPFVKVRPSIVHVQVGEGLCPRGSDTSTTVQLDTIVLGSDGDIFVGGTFESRVWDGRHFVRILHVAHFDSKFCCHDSLILSFVLFRYLSSSIERTLRVLKSMRDYLYST